MSPIERGADGVVATGLRRTGENGGETARSIASWLWTERHQLVMQGLALRAGLEMFRLGEPLEPANVLGSLQLGAQNNQAGLFAQTFLSSNDQPQDLKVMQLAEMILGPLELLDPFEQGGGAPGFQGL